MAQTDFSQILADPNLTGGAAAGGIVALIMGMIVIFAIVSIIGYAYFALALMFTAKKLKTEPAWLAWIPIGNMVLMAKMAKMPTWPVWFAIGLFIPVVNWLASMFIMVMGIIWTWKILEARGRPGWWVLLGLVPVIGWIWGLVMWGILAWGK